MILAIAGRELRSLFLSPLAWAVLAVSGVIVAVLFIYFIDLFVQRQSGVFGASGLYGVTDWVVAPSLGALGFVGLFVMPLITMRLISGERQGGTLTLLISSPVPVAHIVLGKFLAAAVFAVLLALIPVLMSLALIPGTSLDYGQFAAAFLGTVLMLLAFAAVGELVSSLTASPVLAAVITYGVLLLLWIIEIAARGGGQATALLKWLSILGHQNGFQRGLVNTADLAYYVLIIALFLLLGVRRMDAERLRS